MPRNHKIMIKDLDLLKIRSKSLPILRIQNENFLINPNLKDQKHNIFTY